ncbi:MAG: DUF4190 domain-containing protein [Pyrinomonadaceae bacterium]
MRELFDEQLPVNSFVVSTFNSSEPLKLFNCPACGAGARREEARYCATCGREFSETNDYLPADSLRASYHEQSRERHESFLMRATNNHPEARAHQSLMATRVARSERNLNGAAQLSLAFATYAVVPYLGILFCPGAIIVGFVGLARVHRSPQINGRRASLAGIVIGLLVLCVQLFLWWILYEVPKWARGF